MSWKYTYHVLGTVGLCVIKLSVLFFFRRIFQNRILRILNNVLIGLTVALGVAFTFTVAFQCWPAKMFWEKFEHEYPEHCVDVREFYLAVAVSDMILDALIFILPIPHLVALKMPWGRKLAVIFIFLLGSIVVACGIIRIIIFKWVIEFMTIEPMTFVNDSTWYSAGVLFWHLTENVVGLIGCCLPIYRPLIKRYLPMLKLGSTNASSGTSKIPSDNRNQHLQYQRQQDDGFPLSQTGLLNGRGLASSAVDEEWALGSISPHGIIVHTEFRHDSQLRI